MMDVPDYLRLSYSKVYRGEDGGTGRVMCSADDPDATRAHLLGPNSMYRAELDFERHERGHFPGLHEAINLAQQCYGRGGYDAKAEIRRVLGVEER